MALILNIIALGLMAAVLAVFLKESRMPVMAYFITLVAGIIILFRVVPALSEIFRALREVADTAGLRVDYLALILKVVCVSYLGEFAAQLCRDSGEGSIAKKIELGVKVVIMLMALPLLQALLSSVTQLLA